MDQSTLNLILEHNRKQEEINQKRLEASDARIDILELITEIADKAGIKEWEIINHYRAHYTQRG